MSRRLAAVLLTAAVVSGCGTGLQAQTYKESGRSDGTSTDLESLAIRNLHIEPPTSGTTLAAGSSAVLTGSLVNHGDTPETLTTVSTDVAGAVSFTDNGQSSTSITIPAGGSSTEWTAVLNGLNAPIPAGTYISVTLEFTNAGRTTLHVPMQIGDASLGSREVEQEPYGEGG